MYQVLENPRMMSKDEIDKTYDGKWVYIVKASFTKHEELTEGMPVVIGDTPFDGVEDGIYDQFRGNEFEEKFSYPLLHRNRISSVFGMRWIS